MVNDNTLHSGALLYEHYHLAMLMRAKKYLPDVYDAEDAVSNCWIRLLPRIDGLMKMEEEARSAYILTTVENEAIDYWRKKHRQAKNTVMLVEDIADSKVEDEINSVMLCETLQYILSMLPRQEAKVVKYKLEGRSNEMIAQMMNISQSTVRVYWSRGKEKLSLLVMMKDE